MKVVMKMVLTWVLLIASMARERQELCMEHTATDVHIKEPEKKTFFCWLAGKSLNVLLSVGSKPAVIRLVMNQLFLF